MICTDCRHTSVYRKQDKSGKRLLKMPAQGLRRTESNSLQAGFVHLLKFASKRQALRAYKERGVEIFCLKTY